MELLRFFRLEPIDIHMGEDCSKAHQPDAEQRASDKDMKPVIHVLLRSETFIAVSPS